MDGCTAFVMWLYVSDNLIGNISYEDFGRFLELRHFQGCKKLPERLELILQAMATFSCSIQLCMKFILLINVKMSTLVGILTFISRICE